MNLIEELNATKKALAEAQQEAKDHREAWHHACDDIEVAMKLIGAEAATGDDMPMVTAVRALKAALDTALEEMKKSRMSERETSRVFDTMWDADQRAISAWQAEHPGNDLVWPDRAKLTTWIIPRLIAAEAALEAIHDYAHDHSTGPAVPDHLWHIRRIAQAIVSPVDAAREATLEAPLKPKAP